MKHDAVEFALRYDEPADRINVLREYVQACVLRSLHESMAFENLSFVGGTALRFIYDLARYSEDLDFSLEIRKEYDPLRWMAKLKRDLSRSAFDAEVHWNDQNIVHNAWIKIPEIMRAAGIVARSEQKLSVKVEIDTNPPKGALTETRILNRHFLFAIRHHDLPSLMAGKVHALLTRPYVKGRDWYDLLWYRTQRPPAEPNPELLDAALAQTGMVRNKNWREAVREKLDALDFEKVRADVEPFLERRQDLTLLTKDNMARALK